MKKLLLILFLLCPSLAFAATQLVNSTEIYYNKTATTFDLHLVQFNLTGITDGQILKWNTTQSKFLPYAFTIPYSSVTGLNTANVSELTNLYYTTARTRNDVNATDPVTYSAGMFGFNSTLKSSYDSAVAWGNHSLAGYVVNATNYTAGQLTVKDVIYWNLTPVTNGTTAEGKMYYDQRYHTLSLNSANSTNLQIGQETWIRGIATENISNGQAVYLSGASGIYPAFSLANASSLLTAYVAGVATMNITNTSEGFITCRGVIHDLNTDSWTSGDNLYLSATDPGNYTITAPESPNIQVRVGRVIVKSATLGSIYSNPQVLTSQVVTTTAGAGSRVFYLNDTASDISTYEILATTPASGTEEFDNKTVANNETLIASYATPAGGLGRTVWEGGNWEFPIYANVSSTLNTGISQIKIFVYHYAANTTETELFNVTTGDITTTAITLYDIKTTQPSFAVNSTDRLVVKYYANTTKTAARSVGFVHGGTKRYSLVSTPLQLRHNDLAGLDGGGTSEYYHLTQWQKNATTSKSTAKTIYNITTSFAGVIDRVDQPANVSRVWALCESSTAANVTFKIEKCLQNGTACIPCNATAWKAANGTVLSITSFDNATLAVDETIKLNTTAVDGNPPWFTVKVFRQE